MSRKTVIISIAVTLIAVLLIAFLVVRFSEDEKQPELISKEYAIELGDKFLRETLQLHDSVEFDAVVDGDSWRVFSTPGSDETGRTLDEYFLPCHVFINAETGEYLTYWWDTEF